MARLRLLFVTSALALGVSSVTACGTDALGTDSCRKIEQVLASGIIAPFLRVACELARPLAIDASAAVGVAIGMYCCCPGH